MDCGKIGQLISQLRREKDMTQKDLADRLGISNKTVSKWENGLGCPDLSLWEELSAVLGADVRKLLRGELTPNRPDAGRMDRVKFYVCPVCGNVLTSTGGAELSCCGRPLEPLCAQTEGDHAPTVEELDLEYYVTFDHPMTKAHFIRFAAYVTDDRYLLVRLYPEQSAALRLPMLRRGTLYVCCSRDGLRKYPFPAPREKKVRHTLPF